MADTTKAYEKFRQYEVDYVPVSTTSGSMCANCRWFGGASEGYCHIVRGYPFEIMQTGWCERHEAVSESQIQQAMDAMPGGKADDAPATTGCKCDGTECTCGASDKTEDTPALPESHSKTLLSRAGDALKAMNPFKKQPELSGVKVYDDGRFVIWWTNAYQDKEYEFFPESAIDRFIQRTDTGVAPMPEVWAAHIKGSRIGMVDMLGGIGRFAIATGTFDDTPAGQHAKVYYSTQPAKVSHGFMFPREKFIDGVYHDFNTFEISLLPPGWEANPYTSFEKVKSMQLSEDKINYLKQVVGDEEAARIVADTEKKDKALEAMGVAYKDFSTPDDGTETADVQAAAKAAEENSVALFGGVVEDISSLAETQTKTADVLKQQAATIDSLTTQVKALTEAVQSLGNQVQAQTGARPRIASKADSTVVSDDQLSDDVKESMKKVDSFWGESVSG